MQKKQIIPISLGILMLIAAACGGPDSVNTTQMSIDSSAINQQDPDTGFYAAGMDDTTVVAPVPAIKRPEGVYRFIVTENDKPAVEHTILFDGSNFKLQERYLKARDSIVVTEGNWSPSNGYIWTYRDQVVAGRYTWKGNSLAYYDPADKNAYPMDKLPVATELPRLRQKKGLYFYGLGNEPFWNVALKDNDSLDFRPPDQSFPLGFKLKESWQSTDTTFYLATNDTSSLKLIMLPYFCSDGMSDFTYTVKIRAEYRSHTYHGCAIVYKNR